jgi:hypothetical protein
MAPITAVIGTVIAIAIAVPIAWVSSIAWIVVGVTRIAIRVVGRIVAVGRVASAVAWINSAVAWINSAIAWVARIYVDGNALGGCFERHKHRQAKSDRAHKNGG